MNVYFMGLGVFLKKAKFSSVYLCFLYCPAVIHSSPAVTLITYSFSSANEKKYILCCTGNCCKPMLKDMYLYMQHNDINVNIFCGIRLSLSSNTTGCEMFFFNFFYQTTQMLFCCCGLQSTTLFDGPQTDASRLL